ncbi:hypothetical protein Mapa_005236 [Marchantia paleacea]|nr:hypothetical protein Mapa_005236 [Marchantia paleacea]
MQETFITIFKSCALVIFAIERPQPLKLNCQVLCRTRLCYLVLKCPPKHMYYPTPSFHHGYLGLMQNCPKS